ncbi:MAG TPA: YbaB/EbfC family nucleoid-associated protein [Alphaproteobacteria bacterium]|nr:YbaB/EbfC family nucleoid-associated protein [Alphaproteobacteria bacterium]
MNIQEMMKQAKMMQDKMQAMQEKLGDQEVEGTAGGGLVKAVTNCKGETKGISIDDSMMDLNEKEVLEDLIKAALNDAKSKADQKLADETKKMMEELGLPAGMQLPL